MTSSIRSCPQSASRTHNRTMRNLKALVMTLTEDKAIAAAAMAGESIQPKAG